MIQNILLVGAFVLLGIIILSLNNIIFTSNKSIIENEGHITGIGLAQALMEEITSQAFDENSTGNQFIRFLTELTESNEFGKEAGEPPFDDVDDYHNYTTTINTPRIDGYTLNAKINYANPFWPKNDVFIRTRLKRVVVTVTNKKYMHDPDSVSISSIVGYYK